MAKKNILWIVSDQHRAQALGINGDANVNTPNLDMLAKTGVNFTDAVSGTPLCCPFRGSMLTGVYPHRAVPGHERQLNPKQPTVANVFNDNGYDTFYLGKWHLDGFKEATGRAAMHIIPPERRGGFKTWIGYENNNSQWDCWVHGGEGKNAFHERLKGYETDCLTDRMIGYIDERGQKRREGDDEPFFAVLSVQPPHDPYIAPARNMKSHNAGTVLFRENVPNVGHIRERASQELSGYYAMIENLDENIGRILESLRNNDLYFDTHILFFSDHGDMLGSHGQFRKTTAYEESVRVPFIISGENPMYYNGRTAGNIPGVFINHADIAPTSLGLCGISAPEWMQGTDYSHYRLPENTRFEEPDSAYFQSIIPTMHGDSVDKPWRGVITADGWKYACFPGMPWLLFDLNTDPHEQVNLAHNAAYRDRLLAMNAKVAEWMEKLGDSFKLPVIEALH
ncbi:MAG: sulfatase [Oscillospiraceae bacterium]